MGIQAIIFDVDGTLADTEDGHRQAFNKAFAEIGLKWQWDRDVYDQLLSVTGGKERIKYFVSDFQRDFVPPPDFETFVRDLHGIKTRHYTQMVREGQIPLRPGIRQLIYAAHQAGLQLAIATTTAPDNVAALLETGLEKDWQKMFVAVGCGDMVPNKKPAPDVYLWVMERLGRTPAECIALEDSENGLRSSLAAGIKTFITLNHFTRRHDFSGAAAVLEDLSDLPHFTQLSGLTLPVGES
ncbi:MAG: HAD-IA family hydrolase [Rhodoferax sp.]|nr:HAD-IA family hydrolase [Rhodoferax sp.]MCF8210315.1 HAD-IA family hydrolase [Rhodoferax sp.]